MKKMDPVVHFEMPYGNKKRMVNFYGKVFGWQQEMLGPEMGNYVVVSTSERDPITNFPKKPGMINGGFFEKTKDNEHPRVIISVADIKESMKKVEESGGKITGGSTLGQPDDISGVGLYIAFIDTEGNKAGMIQPKGM